MKEKTADELPRWITEIAEGKPLPQKQAQEIDSPTKVVSVILFRIPAWLYGITQKQANEIGLPTTVFLLIVVFILASLFVLTVPIVDEQIDYVIREFGPFLGPFD